MIAPFINPPDTKVALWVCRECKNSGTLMIESLSVYDVVENLDRLHKDVSKGLCQTPLPTLLRPQDWYRAVIGDAQEMS
jgi:hypothetical protein